MRLTGSDRSNELRGGRSDRNQKEDSMNTMHHHGSVDARTELFDIVRGTTACSQMVSNGLRTELFDIVRGTTACSQMVSNGLLAWAYLHARSPSKAHAQTKHTGWMPAQPSENWNLLHCICPLL